MPSYTKEHEEWKKIAEELAHAGSVTAFDVSEEQRKRMAARGEKPMTYDEILAEMATSATEQ